MKKIAFFFCFIICTVHTFYAQQELLTSTDWYIDFIVLDGVTHPSPITGNTGPINTNITFENDIAFAVIDPESDSFFANITYNDNDGEFTFTDPAITLPGCQAFCDFADLYFTLLAGNFMNVNVTFSYEIVILDGEDGGIILTITDENGDIAVYQDAPILSTNDVLLLNASVYPNPTSDILYMDVENTTINNVSLFDINGKKLETIIMDSNNSVDISLLPKGIYFINISTDVGNTVRKIIKD